MLKVAVLLYRLMYQIGSEDNGIVLLACDAEFIRRQMEIWALKMEAICLSETLVSSYESTRLQDPEEQHWRLHRRENLRHQRGWICMPLGRCEQPDGCLLQVGTQNRLVLLVSGAQGTVLNMGLYFVDLDHTWGYQFSYVPQNQFYSHTQVSVCYLGRLMTGCTDHRFHVWRSTTWMIWRHNR
jgi:hypothetical protein